MNEKDLKALILRYISLGSSALIAKKDNDPKLFELEAEMNEICTGLSMTHEDIILRGQSLLVKAE